jgi:hypothetical protein
MRAERYERPGLRELGSVRELTREPMNKVGQTPDMFTITTLGVVVGSLVPAS